MTFDEAYLKLIDFMIALEHPENMCEPANDEMSLEYYNNLRVAIRVVLAKLKELTNGK